MQKKKFSGYEFVPSGYEFVPNGYEFVTGYEFVDVKLSLTDQCRNAPVWCFKIVQIPSLLKTMNQDISCCGSSLTNH